MPPRPVALIVLDGWGCAAPGDGNANDLRKLMLQDHEIVLGGGQQKLDGQIFRIGHLGLATEQDIASVISGLRASLPKVGFSIG